MITIQPDWTADQALIAADLLERILAELWHEHGPATKDEIERIDRKPVVHFGTRRRARAWKDGEDDIPF